MLFLGNEKHPENNDEDLLSFLTSGQELHDKVEVPLVLEAVEHLHHPGAVCLY